MPDIQAFHGLRYDLGHVGSLSDVVAPPYDVIDPDLQEQLYKRHPANVVRLILNREEPGDDESSNRYTRAATFLRNWQREGLLTAEPQAAVYVYHQQFEHDGVAYTRRGFMARVRLEPFGQGKIYPHEETMSGPKADRLKLTTACRANLSQIFGLYPDPENEAQSILEEAIVGAAPLEAVDHLGVVHRIWPVTDPATIAKVAGSVGPKPAFVADGHHRYETACNYRDQLAAGGILPADHPANFVLMMCVGMSDPGMIVLATHRLFRGLPAIDSAELTKRLGDCFTCRTAGEGANLAPSLWDEIDAEDDQGQLALYTAVDRRWQMVKLTDAGRKRMDEVAADHTPDWRGLGVSLLDRLIIRDRLGGTELPNPRYLRSVDQVSEELATGEYPLGALVMPATLDHIRTISEHNERMPAKSTYFYPKLLSGLVINPLE